MTARDRYYFMVYEHRVGMAITQAEVNDAHFDDPNARNERTQIAHANCFKQILMGPSVFMLYPPFNGEAVTQRQPSKDCARSA